MLFALRVQFGLAAVISALRVIYCRFFAFRWVSYENIELRPEA